MKDWKKLHFGVVSEPHSPNTPVYIIGGGPSLQGLDFERLRGQTVIAVNGSVLSLPWAGAVVSADLVWITKSKEDINSFQGKKYLVVAEPLYEGPTWLKKVREPGLSDNPGEVNVGGTSGYAALNVAYLLGAPMIYLLGYDYCNTNQHWFPNYKWHSQGSAGLWDKWASNYESMLPRLKTAGVQVYNCNPNSKITAFPKISLGSIPVRINK